MACRNFSLQKENVRKFQLRFVKCCTLIVTDILPYIIISAEQISQMPFYYVQDLYHKNQLET